MLVPMLKKSLENKVEWPNQVKFSLYACRAAPNRDIGFSPFQLVYSRNIRGPLVWLHEAWDPTNRELVRVCEWVEELENRLELMRDVARAKLEVAKDTMKASYDKGAKARSFDVGDMVLL